MSETPLTDAAEAEYRKGSNDWTVELNKAYAHARRLELAANALAAELRKFRELYDVEAALAEFDKLKP